MNTAIYHQSLFSASQANAENDSGRFLSIQRETEI